MELRRYVVKCMFQVTYFEPGGKKSANCSWVERVFYIRAKDLDSSYRHAEDLCMGYECDYVDRNGFYVSCRLYEITDSYELQTDRLQSGTELYNNFFDASTEEVEWLLRRQYGDKEPSPPNP